MANRHLVLCRPQINSCHSVTDVKDVMKTESCMRIALYQHFQEDPTFQDPGHLCCTVCRENASVLVMAVPWVKFTTYQPLKTQNNLRVLQQGN